MEKSIFQGENMQYLKSKVKILWEKCYVRKEKSQNLKKSSYCLIST